MPLGSSSPSQEPIDGIDHGGAFWPVCNLDFGRFKGTRRQRNGILLVAGTLIQVPDWPLLCTALGHPEDAPAMRRRTVACEELTERPPSAAALVAGLEHALALALPDAARPQPASAHLA